MKEEVSVLIHRRFGKHAIQPDICCNFRWEKGSVVFWDNRCLQHCALNNNPASDVELTISGDRPC